MKLITVTIPMKLSSSAFSWSFLFCCTRWFYLSSLWIKPLSVTIQIKAIEQCFPVILFILLYKVVLTFESVDSPKCSHSFNSY